MKLHATGRDLLIKESERLISGSIKIYECEFTFDESWDGYTVTAVFSTNGSRLINMAVVDGKCEIPSEVLRPNARIRIGVFGIDGDRRRPTTYSEWITVEQGVDLGGGSAQPPTPSVYEQWLRGLDEKQDEWNANEEARAEAEAARVEAENARVEAEEAREAQETGYVAQAESWAKEAEDQAKEAKSWADKAQEVVGGDFATKAQAQAMADTAESNAKTYTDEQIAAIPTPDVSGQINTHNTSGSAHADIRQAITDALGNGYTKTETLADDTKALFGLDSGAVPDDVLNVLQDVALYKKVPIRTEKRVRDFAEGDTIYLNENGSPFAYIVAKHNYQSDLNSGRTLLIRSKNWNTSRQWNSGINTYANSTTDKYLTTEFAIKFDKKIQEAIAGTKIYYTVGGGDATVAVLERSVFLPSCTELGLSIGGTNVEGEKISVLADHKADFFLSVNDWLWTRTSDTAGNSVVMSFQPTTGQWRSCSNTCKELPMITLPEDFTFYFDGNGNPHLEQDYTMTATKADGSEWEVPVGAQIATGTYFGTGTYGSGKDTILTFDFAPKVVMIYATRYSASDTGKLYNFLGGGNNASNDMKTFGVDMSYIKTTYNASNSFYYDGSNLQSTFLKKSEDGKTLYIYSASNASMQMNSSYLYEYIAIG